MLNETNVAGGPSSAFGSAGGGPDSGGAHVGPAQDTYAKGDARKPEVLGSKKKKKKKKLPKMGETGNPEFGPVQSRNFPTDLMMPGRNKHIKETGEVQQEFVQAALPVLAKGAGLAGKAALNAGKLAGRGLGYVGGKALQGAGNVASKLGTMAAGAGAQTAAAMIGDEVPQNPTQTQIPQPEGNPTQTPMQMDAKQIDTLAGAVITPLASLDKANFDKVYQKIMQGLNQIKTQIK